MQLREVILPFGKKIKQTAEGQGISSDTEFLVQTVLDNEIGNNQKLLELGSGNGIISIMLKANRRSWDITGYEIQPHLVQLARENSLATELAIAFLEKDIAQPAKTSNLYDIVVSNPPYIKVKEGRISPIKERAISRHEVACTMLDLLKRVASELVQSGRAYLMYPLIRWEEFVIATKSVDLKVHCRFISKKGKKGIFVAKLTREIDNVKD